MKLPFYSPPDLRRECIWRKTHHHANWSHFHYGHQHPVSPGLCSTVLSYIPGQAILLSSEMTTSHSLLCPWTSRIAPPPLVLVEGLEFNFTEKIEGARKKKSINLPPPKTVTSACSWPPGTEDGQSELWSEASPSCALPPILLPLQWSFFFMHYPHCSLRCPSHPPYSWNTAICIDSGSTSSHFLPTLPLCLTPGS